MSRGKLIVLTGMDGSGKTTQAQALARLLRAMDAQFEYLWCRGRNLLSLPFMVIGRRVHGAPKTHLHIEGEGDRAREVSYQSKKTALLRNPVIRAVWTFAVLAERLGELALRVPLALRRNHVVIADRYLYDSLVDLAADFGEPPQMAAKRLDRWYVHLLPRPDTVVLLDLPPEVAYARKTDIPSLDYLAWRRAIYRSLAERGTWTEVDASRMPEVVLADVRSAIEEHTSFPTALAAFSAVSASVPGRDAP